MFCDKCGGLLTTHTEEGCTKFSKRRPEIEPEKARNGFGVSSIVEHIIRRYQGVENAVLVHFNTKKRIISVYATKFVYARSYGKNALKLMFPQGADIFTGAYSKGKRAKGKRLELSEGTLVYCKTHGESGYSFISPDWSALVFKRNCLKELDGGLEYVLTKELKLAGKDCGRIKGVIKKELSL